MRTTIGVLLCAAAVLVAGCGTVSGEAQPASPTSGDPTFDPCDDIPDEAIRGIGLDPETEERGILGVEQPGWRICVWDNTNEIVSVYASGIPLEEVRRNPDFVEFDEIDLDGRKALTFRDAADADRERCLVATRSGDLMVMVSAASTALVNGPVREPCALVREAAAAFLAYMEE
ncbi:DUF3558 domain-containing protein [Rhodococcus triatomae]|nr:hypothetical protein G419_05657 [Rhodococcus triatomae BKS 15-14]